MRRFASIRTASVLAAIALAGCQTDASDSLPAVNTPSGKPEVTISNASTAVVKSAILNHAISRGWTVANDTPNTVRLEKPADSLLVQMLFGSQMNTTPDYRLDLTLIQLGNDTRVVAESSIVTNPGTGFEQKTVLQDGPAVRKTYFDLTTELPNEVKALESKPAVASSQ